MRIGIDIDDTLIDSCEIVEEYAYKHSKEYGDGSIILNNIDKILRGNFIEKEMIDFFNDYACEMGRKQKVKKNAKEIIDRLKDEENSIYIITARSDRFYKDVNKYVKEFLDENNINYYINMYNQIKESLEQYITNENPRIIFNVGLLCNPMIDTNYTKNLKNINISIEYYYLASKLIDLGATITNPFYFPHCLNSSEKSFTIDPSGINFLLSSYNEFIENPLIMLKNNILQIEKSHEKRCIGCEFLSMCNGGCKFNSLKNSIKSCRKTIISEEIEYLMELLYKGEFDENGFFRKKLYKN